MLPPGPYQAKGYRCGNPLGGVSLTLPDTRLVDGFEGHEGEQFREEVEVPDDLHERAEAAEGLEVGQRDRHLWLVVVICVHVGPLGMEPLSKLFVGVRLLREARQKMHEGARATVYARG